MMPHPQKRGRPRTAIPKPIRKPRRVSRACDNCRLRKSKCDGHSPCTFCTLHRFQCTYDNSRPKKQLDTRYIIELERTIENLKAIIGIASDVELSDEILASAARTYEAPGSKLKRQSSGENTPIHNASHSSSHGSSRSVSPRTFLETMVGATGQLNIDESGNCDYNGNCAGLTMIRRIRECCNSFLDGEKEDFVVDETTLLQSLTSPSRSPSASNGQRQSWLPPKDIANQYISIAFDQAFPLFRFIHRPSFNVQLDQFYAARSGQSFAATLEDLRFEALLNELLALGELFSMGVAKANIVSGDVRTRAEMYFETGKDLAEIMDCRDITSLQGLICMIIYLQASGMIPTCYSYISLAMAACTRMGLHRSDALTKLNAIERETRKRIFWALRTMDAYITTILDLPRTLCDEDTDQEFPCETEDRLINEHGIQQCSLRTPCSMTAVNAHTKLLIIMAKAKRAILGASKANPKETGTYRVDYARIVEAESELEGWFSNLPQDLNFHEAVPTSVVEGQLLLRLAYAHVQMVLYRPFVHYIAKRRTDADFDLRGFACASACINAAMQVIWLDEAIEAKGMHIGSMWLLLFTTFVAVVCLLMFVLSNRDDPTVEEYLSAASKGYRIISQFSSSHSSAKIYVECLQPIFEKLSVNRRSQEPQEESITLSPPRQPRWDGSSNSTPSNMLLNDSDLNTRWNLPTAAVLPSTMLPDPVRQQFEPHLQAMSYAPVHPFQNLASEEVMMEYFSLGSQYPFPDVNINLPPI